MLHICNLAMLPAQSGDAVKFKNSNIKTIQARQKANKEIRQLKALTPKEFAKLVKDNENRKINEQEKELAKKIREIDDSVVFNMTKNEAKIMKRINYWKKLISESYEQEFRGDARKDNICWEAMEKIGCPLYASNYDYQSMKEAMWHLLKDLEDVMKNE